MQAFSLGAGACLVTEDGSRACRLQGLWRVDSVVEAPRL